MAIYVDQLHNNPPGTTPRRSCHLMGDTEPETEAFARRLYLPTHWRHNDHYDVNPVIRAQAIAQGAQVATTLDLVEIRRRRRVTKTPPPPKQSALAPPGRLF